MTLAPVPPSQWAAEHAARRGMRGIPQACVHPGGPGLKTPGEPVQTLERLRNDQLA